MRPITVVGALAAATILLVPAANAADIARPVYKAPHTPLVYNWTGFYIGGNAGYGWGKADTVTTVSQGTYFRLNPEFAPLISSDASRNFNVDSLIAGGQIGFNSQTGNWVWGIEADFQYFDMDNSASVSRLYPGFAFGYTTAYSISTDWLFTARGRLGWAVSTSLFYVTGGLALADLNYSHTFNDNHPGWFATEAASISRTKVGWTLGGGAEFAVGGGWSLKAEYLYVDLGSVSVSSTLTAPFNETAPFTHSVDLTAHIVRAGINYRFDWSKAPVVAKY